MSVSLKLARRLVQELYDLQNQKRGEAEFQIQNTIYSCQAEAEQTRNKVADAAIATHLELLNLRYALRDAIGTANQMSGINSLTCQLAELEEQVNLPCSARYGVKIRNPITGLVETAILAPQPKQGSELRLKIANLKDKISVINSQTTIEVDESVMQQITAYLGINI